MRHITNTIRFVVAAAGVLGAAACGGDGDAVVEGPSPTAAPTASPATSARPTTIPRTTEPATTTPATTSPPTTAPATMAPATSTTTTTTTTTSTTTTPAARSTDAPVADEIAQLLFLWVDDVSWGSYQTDPSSLWASRPVVAAAAGQAAEVLAPAGSLGTFPLAEVRDVDGECAGQSATFGGDAPPPAAETDGYLGELAVVAPWPAQPRPVIAADAPAGLHEEGAILAEGLGWDPTVGGITQVLLADLDGNGMAEEIATFEFVTPTMRPLPGSYSIVFVRDYLADGTSSSRVVAAATVENPELPDLDNRSLLTATDVDGDGTMEVITEATRWEGFDIEVWAADQPTPALLLAECDIR